MPDQRPPGADWLEASQSLRQRSRQQRQRWLRLFLLASVFPALMLSISWIVPGAMVVAQTGVCPPAPTDVLPRACSVGDYFLRMTLSPWAIVGHLFMSGTSLSGWDGWLPMSFCGGWASSPWPFTVTCGLINFSGECSLQCGSRISL
ncbi:MAG: hypothetical protein AAGE59_21020 [Cyanobacteria bacterium P01_F01_bin.86]